MKFLVWVKEKGSKWEPNGEGQMTEKTAKRIEKEIRQDCPGVSAKALPVGIEPQ